MMNRQLKKTTIDVAVELGRSTITIEEFLKLSIDDVITLDQELSSPLHMNVGGALKFKGQPGLQRDRMAIQVTDIVGGTEDE